MSNGCVKRRARPLTDSQVAMLRLCASYSDWSCHLVGAGMTVTASRLEALGYGQRWRDKARRWHFHMNANGRDALRRNT